MTNEIRRLYIIGAGASSPYNLPTLKTLLWDICKFFKEEDQKILKQAIYETFRITLERPEDSPDFESFLNMLDARSLLYLHENKLEMLPSIRQRAAVLALKGLREYIHQKCLAAENQKGLYDYLVQSLREDQAIVSFNWDVLLEVAFHRVGHKYTYLEPSKEATLLLRPHGCISWFALLDRELLKIDTRGNVDVLGDKIEDYYMCYLKDPLGPRDMGNSNSRAKNALSPLAAIVPPNATNTLTVGGVPHDNFVVGGYIRAMRDIWSTFSVLSEEANEIVVIGYSLPGTDAATIEVMRTIGESATARISSKRLLIVDKDKKVLERYRQIVFSDAEHVCVDFRESNPKTLWKKIVDQIATGM